jgi:glutamine synthetase
MSLIRSASRVIGSIHVALGIRAESYLKSTGIADTVYFGPEAEFFVFKRRALSERGTYRRFLESIVRKAIWNTNGQNGEFESRIPHSKQRRICSHCLLSTRLQDFRTEVANELKKAGIQVECHHHEVATAGQCENRLSLLNLDWHGRQPANLQIHGTQCGSAPTQRREPSCPSPLYGDNGSGMHCHQSLWKDGQPLFSGDGYAGLSELALFYIGRSAETRCGHRCVCRSDHEQLQAPGARPFEAPVNLAYSARNRSAGYSHSHVF